MNLTFYWIPTGTCWGVFNTKSVQVMIKLVMFQTESSVCKIDNRLRPMPQNDGGCNTRYTLFKALLKANRFRLLVIVRARLFQAIVLDGKKEFLNLFVLNLKGMKERGRLPV